MRRTLIWCLVMVAVLALVARLRATRRAEDFADFTRCADELSAAAATLEEAKWDSERYPSHLPGGSCPRTGEPYEYQVDPAGTRFTLSCHGHPEFRPALCCVGRPPSPDGVLREEHTDHFYQPSRFRL